MSLFKTRGEPKTRRERSHAADTSQEPAAFDSSDSDAVDATVEGVSLDRFVLFVAMVGRPNTALSNHEVIAQALGFPHGRYDQIRNAWMTRIYSTPALAQEFGERLDTARQSL